MDLYFDVATFNLVFDTSPFHEILTLADLVLAMRRFEVRADVTAAVDRELAAIARARARVESEGGAPGPAGQRLTRAHRDAVSQGRDPAVAVAAETAKLEEHARKDAKTNLRLWSPARYREAKRGSENVAALSCLVLDYDAGVSIEDAAATWEEFFHCLHTTWSHREDRPRFRVILPLARPVAAADWTAVWAWAARQADDMVDHALKGAGATFALPATPSLDSPRVATVHAGELLDPELVGIPLGPVDPTPDPSARPVRMLREDAKREVLDVEASDP